MPQTRFLNDADLRVLLASERSLTFGDVTNRNRAAKLAGPSWFKSSMKSQVLDLHYVDDSNDPVDRGLYNQNAFWSTLYMLNPPGGQRF